MEIVKYGVRLTDQRHPYLLAEENFEWRNSVFSTPEDIVEFFQSIFSIQQFAEEYVYMIALSAAMIPLGVFEISHGSVSNSILSPREIFIRLLLCGAAGFVLVHNHPSGVTNPSKDDILVAERISKAAALMGVDLFDFIILGKDYYSFLQEKKL